MDIQLIEKHFSRMGARAKLLEIQVPSRRTRPGIDIGTDKFGEFFDIKFAADDEVNYEVIDLNKSLRHLLLMARRASGKEKFGTNIFDSLKLKISAESSTYFEPRKPAHDRTSGGFFRRSRA